MAKIRSTAELPELDRHQWQNLVHQVDTANEERAALFARVEAAEKKTAAHHDSALELEKQLADAKRAAKTEVARLEELVHSLQADKKNLTARLVNSTCPGCGAAYADQETLKRETLKRQMAEAKAFADAAQRELDAHPEMT